MGTPRWWAPVLGISLCDELSWPPPAGRPLAAGCWLLAWRGMARHGMMAWTKRSWVLSPYRGLHEDRMPPVSHCVICTRPSSSFPGARQDGLGSGTGGLGDGPAGCAEVARKISESRQACQGASKRPIEPGTTGRVPKARGRVLCSLSLSLISHLTLFFPLVSLATKPAPAGMCGAVRREWASGSEWVDWDGMGWMGRDVRADQAFSRAAGGGRCMASGPGDSAVGSRL